VPLPPVKVVATSLLIVIFETIGDGYFVPIREE
jgi:hypothetical protein